MMSQQSAKKTGRDDLVGLSVALAAPFLAAAIGGVATGRSVSTWYRTLRKPGWTPPAWIFGPVWSTLYLMMGVASWLVWRTGKAEGREDEAGGALKLYGVHLVFNVLWSVIFFGWRRIGLGLAELIALWGMILATLRRFRHINQAAGLLLVPYQLWATFAALLNVSIWWLNRPGGNNGGGIEVPAAESEPRVAAQQPLDKPVG